MNKMLVAIVVSTALIQGCSTLSGKSTVDSENYGSFVGNASGNQVITGGGDCLRSVSLSSENLIVECQASSKAPVTAEKGIVAEPLARLTYNGTALFAFDSAELSADGERELTNLVTRLNSSAEISTIAVVGHADSTGANDYNQSLSERRAETVRQFLQASLSSGDVKTSGLGETAPVADNSTATGRQRNRRVEVSIEASGEQSLFN